MRLLIVGGGIAGQTTALALSKLSFVTSIVMIEAKSHRKLPNAINMMHTGLWSHSLGILKRYLGETSWDKLQSVMTPIVESGYRGAKGQWIARPSDLNKIYESGKPALMFVRSDHLLESIENVLEKSEKVHFKKETTLTGLAASTDSNSGCMIELSDGSTHKVDIIVAADGAKSYVRSLLTPSKHHLTWKEFVVFRGFSPFDRLNNSLVSTNTPNFQTWSKNARFAGVHVSGGMAWFAAIGRESITKHGLLDGGKEQVNCSDLGPFVNGSRVLTNQEVNQLYSFVANSCQDPMASHLIQNSIEDQITVCDAMQSSRFPFESDSGVYQMKVVNESHISFKKLDAKSDFDNINSAKSKQVIPESEDVTTSIPIIFVGDSAFTLDPILAQGTGMAIEDARDLEQSLEANYSPIVPLQSIHQAIEAFVSHRTLRVRTLHRISKVAHFFGHVNSSFAVAMRDILMTITPEKLKTKLIDYSIDRSLRR